MEAHLSPLLDATVKPSPRLFSGATFANFRIKLTRRSVSRSRFALKGARHEHRDSGASGTNQARGQAPPAAPPRAAPVIAIVRESRRRHGPLLAMAFLGQALALALSYACPDFCARHAVLLSCAVCLALWGLSLVQNRLGGPSLICDGRWLASCSWLIGYLVDLDELDAVYASRRGDKGAINQIAFCTRKRELFRLDLGQWRREDVQALLAVLIESHPQAEFDSQTRLWLQPLRAGLKADLRQGGE
jgi:hypothetical protein